MAVVDAVVKGILLRHSCVTFIVDTHYHQVLDLKWNKRFGVISVYMVRSNFNESRRFVHIF